MKDMGDPWLFNLFLSERPHENGVIKPYTEHAQYINRYERNLKSVNKTDESKKREPHADVKVSKIKVVQETITNHIDASTLSSPK